MTWRRLLSPKHELKRRGSVATIPERLSFEKIIGGQTCSPCTTREFMNYLLFIEHSAENLQFYLWLRDYERRWDALPQSEKDLSPELDSSTMPLPTVAYAATFPSPSATFAKNVLAQTEFGNRNSNASLQLPRGLATIFTSPGSDKSDNPFDSPPRTPSRYSGLTTNSTISGCTDGMATIAQTISLSPCPWSDLPSPSPSYIETASSAFAAVGVGWKPFTIQPFRDEVLRIIAIYLAPGALRELNITDRERITVLHALGQTTHPSAFNIVKRAVETSLRFQAHPNFITHISTNGNKTRMNVARAGGFVIALLGFVFVGLMAASTRGRPWRLFAVFIWFFGVAVLVAAWSGVCIMLLPFRNRHLQPWELWDQVDIEGTRAENIDKAMELLVEYPNSYEDRPWQAAQEKKGFLRKLFDKEVIIQDPDLRKLHYERMCRAFLWAGIFSTVMGGLALALPIGDGIF
ncbi:hypothetical protein DFH27DRAFT_537366 [Peziza echinospora]|nr:hypothetical protein DFH27DRAFT_537366 [Peziza echinospora]